MASTATGHTLPAPFQHYELDDAHDEMIAPGGSVRPQYEHLYQALQHLPQDEAEQEQQQQQQQ